MTDDLLARRETVAGLWRATGFKLDPNFAAMVLVVGLAFTCVVRRFQWRLVFTLAILGGIVATMSRMGIIVGALLIIVGLAPVPSRDPVKALFKRLAVAGVLVAGIAVLYQSSQGLVRSYIDNRLVDLQFGLGGLLTGDAGISSVGSATERSLLLEGTLEVVRQQPFFGVGPQNLQLLMYGITGVSGKGAHNTYLELLAIGGLFGAFALLAYVGFTWAALRRARSAAPHSGMWAPVRAVRLACLAMAMMALVLTVSYNAILWLPLALALASDELARSRSALVSRSTNPSDIADGVQS